MMQYYVKFDQILQANIMYTGTPLLYCTYTLKYRAYDVVV